METAEGLLNRLIERHETIGDLQNVRGKSLMDQAIELCCAMIEADRAAVALASKRELLEEMRLAMNEHMKGKGLYVDPGEALAVAFDAAREKYSQPTQKSQGGAASRAGGVDVAGLAAHDPFWNDATVGAHAAPADDLGQRPATSQLEINHEHTIK